MRFKKFNKIYKYFFGGIISIFLVGVLILSVSAGVNYISNDIKTNYSAGEIISGKFSLNVANHPGNALFTSNFIGNITLFNFIRSQPELIEGRNYNCSTSGCVSDYVSSGAINQLQLTSEKDGFAGFRIDGPGITINDAKIIVNSNAPASCTPNIYVDLFADGEDIITSSKGSGVSCGIRHVGCYDQSNVVEATMIVGKEYCEKIKIPPTPSFILGGKIRKGSGNSNLTMKIYSFDTTNLLGSCKLSQNTQNLEDLSCIVNYSSSEVKDYYVCITTGLNNDYKIGAETTLPNCGTAQGFSSLDSDVNLFAETMTYASSPSLIINQSTYSQFTGQNLRNVMENYIQGKYNSDCRLNSCSIPIKLYGVNQVANFDGSEINYESVGYVYNTPQIYGLNYEPSKITAGNISLEIFKANFVIPIESTDNKIKLYLDGNQLFEKSISIKRSFLFDVNPKVVPFGQNTKYVASSNTVNITKTIWNFGDGSGIQTAEGNSVFHSFTRTNSSSFDINVTAISNQTQASRQFKIFVGNPKEIANSTIVEYKRRVLNITEKIKAYPSWANQKIKDAVRLNEITSELNSIELFYNNASSEEDYQNVMLDLIELNVPYDISTAVSGDNINLGIGYENVNINYIEQIDNKDIVDNDALKEKVIGWMNSNFNPEISFRKVEAVGDFRREPIMTLFTIRTNPIGPISAKTYLVIGQDIVNSGLYGANYNHLSLTSGVDYIVLDTSVSQTFEFLIEGDVDAEILGAYIAPSLSVLGNVEFPTDECNLNNICESGENAEICPEDCSKKWFKFTIWGWVLLILSAFVAYIFLQEWYKHNYQKSLFPENNDLYNLVNFIYNARKSGLSDSDIKFRLKEQSWSGERIKFAFRKIDGKKIGMLEIPIFKWKENKDINKQIANRQPQGLVNARFIKRPY